jgi:hypothetical protein
LFEIDYSFRDRVDPEKLRKISIAKLVVGMHRVLDLVGASLRESSLRGAIHGRTGTLARLWELRRVGDDALAWKFTNRAPQARILELGGDVRPTTAKALAIPMSGGPALTEKGVARYPGGPRQAEAAGHALFLFKSKKDGKPYLVESVGKGASAHLEFWYALRGGVTIPPFRYATKAIAAVEEQARRAVADALTAGDKPATGAA